MCETSKYSALSDVLTFRVNSPSEFETVPIPVFGTVMVAWMIFSPVLESFNCPLTVTNVLWAEVETHVAKRRKNRPTGIINLLNVFMA
jgi:hypothetical protein